MKRDLSLAGATLVVVLGALAALTRVFVNGSWWPTTFTAILLALAIAAGARRLGFSTLASAVGSAAALVVFTYVVHLPAGPLIPGPEQWHQGWALFEQGLVQFRDQPAPTIPLAGLMLIITTSVWVVTHVTHELLVRWRHPGLALVPPAVLWVVPLAVPLPPGRTWPQALPFLAGAALVLLLESDADVASHRRDTDGVRLSASGASVGVAALALAALAPGILPGYQASPWVDLSSGNDPRGYQPIVDIGDRLRLPDDRDVLEVRTDRRTYLRLAALDTFDDNTWRLGPADEPNFRPQPEQLFSAREPLPPEVAIAEQTQLDVHVKVLDLANIYVPVPYQPVEILGPERDEMVYSTVGGFVATGDLSEVQVGRDLRVGVTEGVEYRVRAALPTPAIDQLRAVDFPRSAIAPYLQLPGDHERLAAQAEAVYAAAGATTTVDRAFALQDWFAGRDSDFRYSTDVDVLRGSGVLERFVFDTRTGYCEYFATAMAVMLRATGIPARVAVGFLPGTITEPADPTQGRDLDTYTVSTTDAHAWVEVLFPGYGWIRFEPTPRSDGATLQPSPGDLDPLQTERERELAAAQERLTDGDEQTIDEAPNDFPTAVPRGLERDSEEAGGAPGDSSTPWRGTAVALVLLSVAGLGVVAARGRSHQPAPSGAARVIAAQRRLLATARSLGVGRRPSETAVEVTRRWAAEGRVDEDTAQRFARLCQLAAFGDDLSPDAGIEADHLGGRLAAGLRESVSRRDRLVAPARIPAETTIAAGRDLADRVLTGVRGDE